MFQTRKHMIEQKDILLSPGCCLIVRLPKNLSIWPVAGQGGMGAAWISTALVIAVLRIQGGFWAAYFYFENWCDNLTWFKLLVQDKTCSNMSVPLCLFSGLQFWSVPKPQLLPVWKVRDLTPAVAIKMASRTHSLMTSTPLSCWFSKVQYALLHHVIVVLLCTIHPYSIY